MNAVVFTLLNVTVGHVGDSTLCTPSILITYRQGSNMFEYYILLPMTLWSPHASIPCTHTFPPKKVLLAVTDVFMLKCCSRQIFVPSDFNLIHVAGIRIPRTILSEDISLLFGAEVWSNYLFSFRQDYDICIHKGGPSSSHLATACRSTNAANRPTICSLKVHTSVLPGHPH